MVKLVSFILICLFIQSGETCTIFSLYPNGQHWIGRTFDWAYGHGLIYTNKRNVTKTSLKLLPTDIQKSWTSKYGSVTFNQFGREFPTGGMNEAGLMIDALELKTSIFPDVDSRPSFNELQFIQYVLDNYAEVKDLVKDLRDVRLSPVGSKLHYFVCDVNQCMTIEYIDGELVTHFEETLPISGLANNRYEEHVDYAKEFVTFGGIKPVVLESKDSLDRFVRSNYNAKLINQTVDPTQSLFDFLQDVGSINNRWQLIYKQDEKTITFRTQSKFNKQRKIDLTKIDFSCRSLSQFFDLDSETEGDVNVALRDYDFEINLQVIIKSVKLQGLPSVLSGKLAIYPAETLCN
jgi:penicillin V acylase-like amidase (Ntn superfamily)